MESLSAHPFLYRAPSYSLPCIQCPTPPRRNTPLLRTSPPKRPIHCTHSPILSHRTIQVYRKRISRICPKRRKRYSRKLAPCSKALGKTHIENTSFCRKYSINLAKQHLSVLDSPPIPPDHSSDALSRTLTTSRIPLPTLRATYTHRFTPQICIRPITSTYLLNHIYVPV